MSIFLHRAKPSSQILTEEKCVNLDNFGYFWKTDVDDSVKDESLDRDISDRLCKSPPKKLHCAKLCENTVLPNFYPNLPKIIHGYICDILQLWARRTKSSRPVGPSTRSRGPKTSGRNFLEANKFSLRESQYKSQSQSRGLKFKTDLR